ncbi:MAG: MaoC family dehydratase N-terminal domain-containing protein [Myxococcota bacterium]
MALDPKFVGRAYGPFTYEVGVEKLREFAYAVGGSIPSMGFSGVGPPSDLHPFLHDKEAAAASEYGAVIGMPNFAVVFAITPFSKACTDPELGVDLLRLVHGEQEFEFLQVVRPGDVLTTRGTITDISAKKSLDFLTVTTESHNQRGEVVVRAKWTAVIRG